MTKRKKARSAPDTTKLISSEKVSTRFYVGEVEYCQFPEAIRRSGAGVKLGYAEGFHSFTGSALYTYLQYNKAKFSSYIETKSGKRCMYPYSEIKEMIDEYLSSRPALRPETEEVESPEISELLEKLRANPTLAKTILEIVA